MMRDDDDGQVDGDGSPSPFLAPGERGSPFADRFGAQPWLRSGGTPPWHLWGNTQQIDVVLSSGNFSDQARGQLTKIAYGRPDSWNWLFTARLLAMSSPPVGTDLNVSIVWELTVGIGRSMQQALGFDSWNIPVAGGAAAPVGRLLWASTAIQANLNRFNSAGIIDPNPPPNLIDRIVAQDIQLNARIALTLSGAAVGYPYSATVEVGAQWAPNTHVRPDWLLEGPLEAQFPGNETGGK